MSSRPLEPLDAAAYAPYGDVIAARDDCATRGANLGTATRFLDVAPLRSTRAGARPHLSVYRCAAWEGPLALSMLERHAHATQVFVPQGPSRYLAVVALGGDAPDLSTLRAFLVEGTAGISCRPGVRHHPMIALVPTDFVCLVWEDGTASDCDEVAIPPTRLG
jgi:ureidoglycolate lyase